MGSNLVTKSFKEHINNNKELNRKYELWKKSVCKNDNESNAELFIKYNIKQSSLDQE